MSWEINKPATAKQGEEQRAHDSSPSSVQQSAFEGEKLSKIISVFGYKGAGKTYNSIGLCRPDQKILAVSFDGVTEIIAKEFFPDYKITVYNAVKYPRFEWTDSPEGGYWVESVEAGYKNLDELSNYLNSLKKDEFDVILFDGLNFAEKLAEAYMRYKKGLKYDEKFADLNNWKLRNSQLNGIILTAQRKAKDFVIYTVYLEEHPITREAGQVMTSIEMPNYVKDVTSLAVIEIKIESKDVQTKTQGTTVSKRHFFATIWSSKLKSVPTGEVYDITGKKLSEFVKL